MGRTFKDHAGYHVRQVARRARKVGAVIVGSEDFNAAYLNFFKKRGIAKHGMRDDINMDCHARG